jgi:hypothetical protein
MREQDPKNQELIPTGSQHPKVEASTSVAALTKRNGDPHFTQPEQERITLILSQIMTIYAVNLTKTIPSTKKWNQYSILAGVSTRLSKDGIYVPGIAPIPGTAPERVEKAGLVFDMARIVSGTWNIPKNTFERINDLESEGYYFDHFVLLEEVGDNTNPFTPNKDNTPLKFLPMQEPAPLPSTETPGAGTYFVQGMAEALGALGSLLMLDPILVGIVAIPENDTDGVWCVLGKWLEGKEL